MALTCSSLAQTSQNDLEALDLTSAPVEEAKADNPRGAKFFVEAAVGPVDRRLGLDNVLMRRLSLDIFYATRLGADLRVVLSNRTDHQTPADSGVDATINNLREAYASWDFTSVQSSVELGRINLRQGPAYGFNPTDFFRDGALRNVVSVNPLAMRENRLGTVMLRLQRLWPGGSVSLALAPKLASRPSSDGWSLDLGATNNRNRALVSVGHQLSDRVSGQLLLYKDDQLSPQVGANLTALISDAIVAHGEWSHAKETPLAARAWSIPVPERRGNRIAAGLTYSNASKLSITAEVQYNSFALSDGEWRQTLASNPQALGGYLLEAERRQDLAARQAYLVYVTQKSLVWKGLDLSAFARVNAKDHSRLTWIELRYHWPSIDAALQWQQYSGRAGSQYAITRDRESLQVVASYHF